jgi:phasin family protein
MRPFPGLGTQRRPGDDVPDRRALELMPPHFRLRIPWNLRSHEEEDMARKRESDSVIDMFAKLGEQMRMPPSDIERVIEHNRKNLEAFEQSVRAAGEGTASILKRQREMLSETLNEFSAMASEMSAASDTQELVRKQTEFARKTFETAVRNTGEMAEMVRKSNQASLDILRKRIKDGMEELRRDFERRG